MNDQDIEQVLTNGTHIALEKTEKAMMKSTLLSYASRSLVAQKPTPSPWTAWMVRGSFSFATLLFVCIGTAYAAQGSLPGEPLYAVKVHVVEEVVALTKHDPLERTAYDLMLMENRLTELKALTTEEVEPETLSLVAQQINEHSTDVHEVLKTTTLDKLPHEARIATLITLGSITDAQAYISHDDDLALITDEIQNTSAATDEILSATIDTFVTNEDQESVQAYVSDQITAVSNNIPETEISVVVDETTEKHLNDVQESLVTGDTEEALRAILDAQQSMETEAYLEGSTQETSTQNTEVEVVPEPNEIEPPIE